MRQDPGNALTLFLNALTLFLIDFFGRPGIAMVAWGAFIHMSGVKLPAFGYWEFFMLSCVCMILTSSQITRWVKEAHGDNG